MASQLKKYKAACDHCHNSKVKCPGGYPSCKRCVDVALPCHYSLAARVGKPPGSKNKKTRGLARQANRPGSNRSESCSKDDITCSPQSSNSIHSLTAFDARSTSQGCNGSQRSSQQTGSPAMQRSSPSMESLGFPNCQQFSMTAEREYDGGLNMDLSIFDEPAMGTPTIIVPSFQELADTESKYPWADRSEKPWNPIPSSSPHHHISNDSPLSAHSRSTAFEAQVSASLDSVIEQLEKTMKTTNALVGSSIGDQSVWCQCLRKYTDVLCHFQTIEICQHPVQIDTLLLCGSLVVKITDNLFGCTNCSHDSRVLTQIVMILQTIFNWTQIQYSSSNFSASEVLVDIGRYKLSQEECRVAEIVVLVGLMNENNEILKKLRSRVEHMTLSKQGKVTWDHELPEIEHLQQVIHSLFNKCDQLRRLLASREDDHRHSGSAKF